MYKNVILSRKVKEDFAREIMFEWGVGGEVAFPAEVTEAKNGQVLGVFRCRGNSRKVEAFRLSWPWGTARQLKLLSHCLAPLIPQ